MRGEGTVTLRFATCTVQPLTVNSSWFTGGTMKALYVGQMKCLLRESV